MFGGLDAIEVVEGRARQAGDVDLGDPRARVEDTALVGLTIWGLRVDQQVGVTEHDEGGVGAGEQVHGALVHAALVGAAEQARCIVECVPELWLRRAGPRCRCACLC